MVVLPSVPGVPVVVTPVVYAEEGELLGFVENAKTSPEFEESV